MIGLSRFGLCVHVDTNQRPFCFDKVRIIIRLRLAIRPLVLVLVLVVCFFTAVPVLETFVLGEAFLFRLSNSKVDTTVVFSILVGGALSWMGSLSPLVP